MTSRNISRRGFLQTAGAGAVTVWVPTKASGYTAAEMRAMAGSGRLQVGARHAGAVRRSRQAGAEPRNDEGEARDDGRRDAPARENAQMPGDRETPDGGRLDRRLHRKGQRSRSAVRQRRREDRDDDVERDGEQDPPRDEDSESDGELHSSSRLRPECARSERRRP